MDESPAVPTSTYEEPLGALSIRYRLRRVLYSGRSAFQMIDIVDTEEYGRMLFLDQVANSSDMDEHIYHEIMVHPAMLTHPSPESVLVIGGGEGATIRDVLRHGSVKRVVMVDIDEELVRLCRTHLPDWNAGSFEDPRVELVIGDGRRYVKEASEKFDVILVDLSDPVPDSPAVFLFTREFYQLVHDRLNEGGVAAFQGESIKPSRITLHALLFNTMADVFPHVRTMGYNLPCFHEPHAIMVASRGEDPLAADLAGRMEERGLPLKYLSRNYMPGLFAVPGYVEDAYGVHREILTDERPFHADFHGSPAA